MITLDGSMGEGGGQILRSALGLSAVTGQPFRIEHIRARRSNPGLLRQHLAGVRAVTDLCGATAVGASLGSTSLTFTPGPIRSGAFQSDVGSAGSAGLVLQALLPALLSAPGEVTFELGGGTHNDKSPPAPFLLHTLVPLLRRMGADLTVELVAHGFFPAGGGRYRVTSRPAPLTPLVLDEAGPAEVLEVVALLSNLAGTIGKKELAVCSAEFGLPAGSLRTVPSPGPGNVLFVRARRGGVEEVFTGFGSKGRPAEDVARDAAREWQAWDQRGAPVGEHLADQLLVPLALAGGGRFLTGPPTEHTTTNAQVVATFLPVDLSFLDRPDGLVEVVVAPRVTEGAR
jgi:RNA 3'-terminal phosphate cyclase (ATP)